jgi:pimeloyl-ACP methyl ester carboxylesterase
VPEAQAPTVLRVVVNGLEHRVLEWAPPEQPPALPHATALLIHGFMDGGATWDLVAPTLAAAGFRVLAPDLRGYGETARVGAGGYYHFLDYVFDVADLVDDVIVPSPLYLVGHSMGGTVATLYAGTFPERVTKLALLEGLGPPDNGWEVGPLRARAWIEGVRATRRKGGERAMASRDDALRRLKGNHPNVDDAVLADRLRHLTRDVEAGVAWKHDPLHRTTSPMPFFAKLFTEFAKKITAPTLFVDGGPLGYHPPDEAERLAAIATVSRATLEGAGHMMHWTRPAPLAAALLAHWRGEPQSTPT